MLDASTLTVSALLSFPALTHLLHLYFRRSCWFTQHPVYIVCSYHTSIHQTSPIRYAAASAEEEANNGIAQGSDDWHPLSDFDENFNIILTQLGGLSRDPDTVSEASKNDAEIQHVLNKSEPIDKEAPQLLQPPNKDV